MRVSSRLLSNAAANYIRLGMTFLLGVFFTWYVIGRIGMTGFGMIALAMSMFSIPASVDNAIRFGLLRELSAAIATGEAARVRTSLTSAVAFCALAAALLGLASALIAALAWLGLFSTPADVPNLRLALVVLLLADGVSGSIRMLCAPYTQALFAAQYIRLDNLLEVLRRVLYVLSAVAVFGFVLPEAPLALQLIGFALSRVTVQLPDVALGCWLARRRIPGLRFRRSAFDAAEFRSIRGTVWHSGQVSLLMDLHVFFIAILINFFFGLAYNGIWQIVVQLGGYLRRFSLGLLHGVEPLSTHLQQQGRDAALIGLMKRTIRYQLGSTLPLAVCLVIFMHPILNLWIGGRLENWGQQLAQAGLDIRGAVNLIAILAYVLLAAQVVRASMYGVQRMLYGVGLVRSYSWFAKYGALISIGLAALLMWLTGSPVAGPVALLITNLIFYPGIVLSAAVREVDLPLAESLAESVPRPLIVAALVCIPAVLARLWVAELTLVSLIGLAAGLGVVYALLFYGVILLPDERARIRELLRGSGGRLGGEREMPADGAVDETIIQ